VTAFGPPPPFAPVTPPGFGSNQVVSPQLVLSAVRSWWHLALPAGLLLAGVAALVLGFTCEQKYEASLMVRISEAEPFVVSPEREEMHYERLVETEISLMRSQSVLEDALRNVFNAKKDDTEIDRLAENLQSSDISAGEFAELMDILREEDPIRWLSKQLQLSPVKGSELLRVSLSCSHARNAQRIVNAIITSYLGYHESERLARVRYVLDELERAKKEQESLVRQLRGELESKAVGTAKQGPDSLAAELPATLVGSAKDDEGSRSRTKSLQSLLFDAELQAATLKAELEGLRQLTANTDGGKPPAEGSTTDADGGVLESDVEKALDTDPELQSMLAALNQRRPAVAQARDRAIGAEEHPTQLAYKRLLNEVATLEAALKKARDDKREVVRKQLRDRMLADSRTRFAQAQSRLNVLREWLDSQRGKLGEYNKDVLGMEFLQNELEKADGLYSLVSERILRLNIEQRAPDRITPIPRDLAPLPRAPMESPLLRNIGLASAACMVAPFALAVLWEMRTRRVSNKQELEQRTRIPVIGEIAPLPAVRLSGSASRSRHLSYEYAMFVETVDALRTRLLLNRSLNHTQVIAITSGTAHEGKTSIAMQLGMSIGQALREVVLVVDGDMRSPDIHNLVEIPLTPGLAELLAGEADLDDAISSQWDEQLHIIPAGDLKSSPHQLLSGPQWPALLEQLRSRYRFIIVDTPPALIASEAFVLTRTADATLLSAIRGTSRMAYITEAHTRLLQAGANPVGVVLSGVRSSHYYRYRDRDYAYMHRKDAADNETP
jgi:capsular exopolysaccharide synthesis family protein